MELLKEKIKDYTHGRLPHAKHVISALYGLMENDESVTETPIPAAAASDQQAIGGDWVGLRKALTSSLISGTFLDSQFYAVESRPSTALPKIRPMYFCSIVGGDFTSKLIACEFSTGVVSGCVSELLFQIPLSSGHKDRHFDVRMNTTVMLTTESLTNGAPWSATHVRNGSPTRIYICCRVLNSKLPASGSVPHPLTCKQVPHFC